MAKGYSKTKSNWIVGLLVTVLIATALLPTIFSNLNTMSSDTTNFSAPEIAILSVIGVLIMVGFLYKVLKESGA